MNNTPIVCCSLNSHWLRTEEEGPDYSNMEVIKTLMIIQSLVMGVTMANKVLGISKRGHILKSLNRAEINEEATEDKPDVRISMEDSFKYESPCPQREDIFKVKEYLSCGSSNDCRFKLVSVKSFRQWVCKEGESVNIGKVERKVCNPEQSRLMYCFTKNEKLSENVEFKLYSKQSDGRWLDKNITKWKTMDINYGVGCYCGWQLYQAGDSDENRAGKK